MNPNLENLKNAIEPYRQEIVKHKVYHALKSLTDVQVFMQHHVYAVWDFMSLLKALQNSLTCTTIPWFPKEDADAVYLINEIVTGEESDVDAYGNRKSHYQLYLEAMHQSGANTAQIDVFIEELKNNGKLETAYKKAGLPLEIINFLNFTFSVIYSNKPHVQAAVFTFGREDLIPDMFHVMVADLYKTNPEEIAVFKYYLERHIEVDGDHHSHLALDMTAALCEDNPVFWKEAENAAIEALKQRKLLWDSVYNEIVK